MRPTAYIIHPSTILRFPGKQIYIATSYTPRPVVTQIAADWSGK